MFKKSIIAVVGGMCLTNSKDNRPDKPQDYYKLSNQAGRNVIQLDGFIGWWDDEAFWLKNYLKEREGEEIELVISSSGGDVFTGQSMYNYLKAHKGKITAYVERAFSIASHILMACDEIKMVKGSQVMIHAVSGYCSGTKDDMIAYASLIENAADAIAESYVERTGHEVDYWRDIMKNEAGKYFSAQEAVELGLADEVIEPSAMTNFNTDDIATNGDDEGEPKTDPEQTADDEPSNQNDEGKTEPPVATKQPANNPTNNEKDQKVLIELQRQKAIRNLYNSLAVRLALPINLLNEALDDENCDLQAATAKFTAYQGEPDEPKEPETNGTNPTNFGRQNYGAHAGGSDAKIMVKNVLLNRAGQCDLDKEHRDYAGMDLQNAARSLGVKGYGQAVAQNALDHQDFKDVIGEVVQEIVKHEAEGAQALVKDLCEITKKARTGEYGVTEYNQIDGFGERNAGTKEFPELSFDGKPRRKGSIVERGSKVSLNREAILNDYFEAISTMPRDHVRAAYRAADRLMFQRLVEFGTKHGVTLTDLQALLKAMNTDLQERTTSKGDELYYSGGLIMAKPALMNTIRPICETKTLSVDVVNDAFGAFSSFKSINSMQDWLVGFASGHKALELAVLQGGETPELIENNSIDRANGMGWTVVWDFDVQVSNPQALVMGKLGGAAAIAQTPRNGNGTIMTAEEKATYAEQFAIIHGAATKGAKQK